MVAERELGVDRPEICRGLARGVSGQRPSRCASFGLLPSRYTRRSLVKERCLSFVPQKQIGVGDVVIDEKARSYVNQVLDSGHLSYGDFSRSFEQRFAALHGCDHAIFMASGTCALQAALASMKEKYGWEDGDEVIVPAMTFIATSNMVLHNNLEVRFAEVDPVSCNLDPTKLGDALSDRTRAIVPVHLFGCPAEMDPIMDFAREHELRILEDSCETMFAQYRGRPVGSFGDAACFSTYVAHLLVTGVGGFVTTNDPEIAIGARSYLNHGRDSIYLSIDDDQGTSKEKLREIVARRFNFVRVGHSFRCTELEAALGLAQLEQTESMLRARRENGRYFLEQLRPLEDAGLLGLPAVREDADHVFMMFPIVVRDGRKRELVNHLEEHRIETRDLMPLLSQPVYLERFGDLRDQFPVASFNSANGLYIGCHPYLTPEEREYVTETFLDFYGA
jgi:dTDP-4-amino-4,6-dideoxygalactose transaminase